MNDASRRSSGYVTQRQRHASTALERALLECVDAGYDVTLRVGSVTLDLVPAGEEGAERCVPRVVVRAARRRVQSVLQASGDGHAPVARACAREAGLVEMEVE